MHRWRANRWLLLSHAYVCVRARVRSPGGAVSTLTYGAKTLTLGEGAHRAGNTLGSTDTMRIARMSSCMLTSSRMRILMRTRHISHACGTAGTHGDLQWNRPRTRLCPSGRIGSSGT